MSLINKMLQDLEARQGGPSNSGQAYQDLRPVRPLRTAAGKRAIGFLLGAVTVGALAAFYAGASLRSTGSEPTAAAPQLDAPLPMASGTPDVVEAPARIEAVVADVPATTPPVADASSVATSETTLPSTAAVSSPPGGMQAIPADADTAPVTAQRSVARDDAVSSPATRPDVVATVKPKPASPAPTVTSQAADATSLDKKVRPLTPQEMAEDNYRRAARLIEQGRGEEARRALRAAIGSDAAHHAARELLVGLELQQGRWREAEELLAAGLQVSPRHYPFAQLLARVRVEHGADEQALAVLETAAPHAAHDPDFLSFLAALYQRSGRHAEAVRAYRQAVALREGDGRTWLGLAIALEAEGQRQPAADAYRRARTVGGLAPALDSYATQRLAALSDR